MQSNTNTNTTSSTPLTQPAPQPGVPGPAEDQAQHSKELKPYPFTYGARRINETVAQFLHRLPPSTTALTTSTNPFDLLTPWYYIANPHRDDSLSFADVHALKRDGLALLEEFRQNLGQCAKNSPVRTQLREVLVGELNAVARRAGVTSGKWMLFPKEHEVDDVWRKVCEGVDGNRLGTGAKVSTSGQEGGPENGATRLICVYTKDFTDVQDVKRVLLGLVELGLVRADMPRGIMYKCDAYTHLGIYGKNEYGLRASIYSSKEMLAGS